MANCIGLYKLQNEFLRLLWKLFVWWLVVITYYKIDHMLIFRLFYTFGKKIHKDLEEVGYHISSAVDTKFCLSCHVNLWIDPLYSRSQRKHFKSHATEVYLDSLGPEHVQPFLQRLISCSLSEVKDAGSMSAWKHGLSLSAPLQCSLCLYNHLYGHNNKLHYEAKHQIKIKAKDFFYLLSP